MNRDRRIEKEEEEEKKGKRTYPEKHFNELLSNMLCALSAVRQLQEKAQEVLDYLKQTKGQ